MTETIYAGKMPILALRGLAVFPDQTIHFDVGRALWLHKPPVSHSIYQFKYHNRRVFGEFYAEELKIMAHLVKGTAFFRKAQVLAGKYGGADICHVEAAQLLEMVYISDRYNLINMLTLLNLGKNLRNMGMHGYRSIYDRALDCFNDIQWRIENELRKSECGKKLTRWESCLWLEAKINIGRIHKYLYKMEEAKEDFWYVLNILLIKGIDRKNDVESTVENDALLRKDKEKKGNSLWMETFLSDYKNEYKKYLLQVLVELGTVYLKERYLGAAKNLFLVTLAIDPKNVDAKNNIAVYLRKRNMPGDNYKAVRILREEEEKGNRFALINVLKCRIAMIGNIEVGNAKEDEGIRLDKVISKLEQDISRSSIQRMIEEGNILVNANKVKVSYKVIEGDYLTIQEEQLKETNKILKERTNKNVSKSIH